MSHTLYHYVHCPYCVRVRMACGYLNIPYKSIVLSYDDEETPVALSNKKMLPIMKSSNGIMNESLDIIKVLDKKNALNLEHYFDRKEEIDKLLKEIGRSVHSLCMPYWIFTAEFDSKARKYFQDKKEVSKGPFSKLVEQKDYFLKELKSVLKREEKNIENFYLTKDLDILDIVLSSHLWGMFVYPDFQFDDDLQ